jgi:tetratricopeptide (TPR) repeat protein
MSDIAKKKNIETPEIEENMLISWFESKFGYLKPHYKTIAIVAGLLVLAGIVGAILMKANRENYAAQWNDLNLAVTEFANDQNVDHLTEMAKINENTPAGLWALQIAGDQELNLGLTKMSNPSRFPKDDPDDLRNTAIRHVKTAKKTFQQILDSSGKRSPLLEQRTVFSMARATESLGEFDEAKKYYTQLIDSAPESEFVDRAKLGVARASNERLVAFYDEFSTTKMQVAPGVTLPDGELPDIDFPDVEIPEPPVKETETVTPEKETEDSEETGDADSEMKDKETDPETKKESDETTESEKAETKKTEKEDSKKEEPVEENAGEETKGSGEKKTEEKKTEGGSEDENDQLVQNFSFYLGTNR